MKKIFAAVVEHEGQLFYVGEEDSAKAATTLSQWRPSLIGKSVAFYELPGSVAKFLRLKKGDVQDWPKGTTIRLEKLTGPVAN
jgi:hypothetical protein